MDKKCILKPFENFIQYIVIISNCIHLPNYSQIYSYIPTMIITSLSFNFFKKNISISSVCPTSYAYVGTNYLLHGQPTKDNALKQISFLTEAISCS